MHTAAKKDHHHPQQAGGDQHIHVVGLSVRITQGLEQANALPGKSDDPQPDQEIYHQHKPGFAPLGRGTPIDRHRVARCILLQQAPVFLAKLGKAVGKLSKGQDRKRHDHQLPVHGSVAAQGVKIGGGFDQRNGGVHQHRQRRHDKPACGGGLIPEAQQISTQHSNGDKQGQEIERVMIDSKAIHPPNYSIWHSMPWNELLLHNRRAALCEL